VYPSEVYFWKPNLSVVFCDVGFLRCGYGIYEFDCLLPVDYKGVLAMSDYTYNTCALQDACGTIQEVSEYLFQKIMEECLHYREPDI